MLVSDRRYRRTHVRRRGFTILELMIASSVFAVILLVVAGTLLFSAVFMLLWNAVLPAVLHVGAITIWQAAGILLLSRILFGRSRRGLHHRAMRRRHMRWQYEGVHGEGSQAGCFYQQ